MDGKEAAEPEGQAQMSCPGTRLQVVIRTAPDATGGGIGEIAKGVLVRPGTPFVSMQNHTRPQGRA